MLFPFDKMLQFDMQNNIQYYHEENADLSTAEDMGGIATSFFKTNQNQILQTEICSYNIGAYICA
jgi:hypothetical protein